MNRLLKKLLDARAAGGSTIVGVLAAMVFITLVTSFMVKNTGAQSAASVGYGTDMVMQSTVRSGVLAAERVLNDDTTVTDILSEMSTIQLNGGNASVFLPQQGGNNQRVSLNTGATGQYFSSKVRNYNRADKNLWVEVSAGKTVGGKGLKRALSFYHIDGIGKPIVENQTRPKNAFYSLGPCKDLNNGLSVEGDATFEGDVTTQNVPVHVRKGTAFFGGALTNLLGENVTFDSTVYFNGDVILNNVKNGASGNTIPGVFGDKVGVWGKFSALNKKIQVFKNFYIKETFGSDNPPGINREGSSNKLYHTKNVTSTMISNANFSSSHEDRTFDSTKVMLDLLGMGSLESRRETQFNITNITSPSVIFSVDTVKISGGSKLNVVYLDSLCKRVRRSSDKTKLYKNHLVVKLENGGTLETMNCGDATFSDSVIFIINGTLSSQGNFYKSGDNSSTMIYVGAGGVLSQFGSKGTFRGLICIGEENEATNHLAWQNGGNIVGALYNFSKKAILWNNIGTAFAVPIKFDSGVLGAFESASGSGGGGSGPSTGSVTEVTNGDVKPIVMGYYFY